MTPAEYFDRFDELPESIAHGSLELSSGNAVRWIQPLPDLDTETSLSVLTQWWQTPTDADVQEMTVLLTGGCKTEWVMTDTPEHSRTTEQLMQDLDRMKVAHDVSGFRGRMPAEDSFTMRKPKGIQ